MLVSPTTPFFQNTGTVPTDGSGKYVPRSAWDFNKIGITFNYTDWVYQHSQIQGNLVPSQGQNLTLTANSGPLYNQSVAGWTRHGTGYNQAAGQKFNAAAGVGPNASSQSCALIFYAIATAVPGATRSMGYLANISLSVLYTSANKVICRCGGVQITGTSTYNDSAVHPFLLVYNRTAGSVKLFTNLETVTGTYTASVADDIKGFGSVGGTNSAPMTILWGAMATGAAAEAMGAATLTSLGW